MKLVVDAQKVVYSIEKWHDLKKTLEDCTYQLLVNRDYNYFSGNL
jgi:hypothetical protein